MNTESKPYSVQAIPDRDGRTPVFIACLGGTSMSRAPGFMAQFYTRAEAEAFIAEQSK